MLIGLGWGGAQISGRMEAMYEGGLENVDNMLVGGGWGLDQWESGDNVRMGPREC